VIGSVLGPPKGAEEQGIRFEAIMVQPDAFRLADLARDVAQDKFTIPIARTLPLHQIREAHKLGETGGIGGKIVLLP
jgi:NADPH:quinone reductase-like Zn-dependent oxidoreductase